MTSQADQAVIDSANIIPTLDAQIPDAAKAANNGGVWPKFFHRPIQNKAKSEQAGRPVHDQVEWVEIIVAGDRNSKVSRKVSDIDKRRWPTEYAAFSNGQKMPIQGTPLDQWAQLGTDQVADLKSLGIMTVEMLAELSDDQVGNYGLGGHQLREKAQAFIETALSQAAPQHFAADNQRLQEDNAELNRQVATLQTSLDNITEQGGADPKEVADLNDRLAQNKTLIDTQALAIEAMKDKIEALEGHRTDAKSLIADQRTKIDEQAQVIGTQKAEIAKLKKPKAPAKKSAAKKD